MPVINLYSFPIELKSRIAKIKIYETLKVTKMISSLSEDIAFVIFTEKSLYFIGKHIKNTYNGKCANWVELRMQHH